MLISGIVIVFASILSMSLSFESGTDDNKTSCHSPSTICYFTNWAVHRQGKGKFVPSNINSDLCNYVIYAFAKLDDSLDTIASSDPDVDISQGFYSEITALRKKNVDVLLALGGWLESTDKYSKMMESETHRRNVISSIVEFLLKYEFIGLDIDIEYPRAYQGVVGTGSPNDKENYVLFLRELRTKLDEAYNDKKFTKRPLLSVAVTGNKTLVDVAYNVTGIVEVVDWIGVMCYDMHINGEPKTGLTAPFIPQPGDNGLNVKSFMELWMSYGAPANKLVVGIPFYGPTFRLVNPNENGINAPAAGQVDKGEFTQSATTMSFYEIVDNIKSKGWTAIHENELGSYAYQNVSWIGYDDAANVALKAQYIREQEFFGGMIWALDYDCFQDNNPAGRPYPLLTTLKNVISGYLSYTEVKNVT